MQSNLLAVWPAHGGYYVSCLQQILSSRFAAARQVRGHGGGRQTGHVTGTGSGVWRASVAVRVFAMTPHFVTTVRRCVAGST